MQIFRSVVHLQSANPLLLQNRTSPLQRKRCTVISELLQNPQFCRLGSPSWNRCNILHCVSDCHTAHLLLHTAKSSSFLLCCEPFLLSKLYLLQGIEILTGSGSMFFLIFLVVQICWRIHFTFWKFQPLYSIVEARRRFPKYIWFLLGFYYSESMALITLTNYPATRSLNFFGNPFH